MKDKNKETSIGGALGTLIKDTATFLSILFCALRVNGIIQWDWYFIMMPIFAKWALGVLALAGAGLAAAAAEAGEKVAQSR